jgi:hypothetical protein
MAENGQGVYEWRKKRLQVSQYVLHNKYVGNWVMGKRNGYGEFFYARC